MDACGIISSCVLFRQTPGNKLGNDNHQENSPRSQSRMLNLNPHVILRRRKQKYNETQMNPGCYSSLASPCKEFVTSTNQLLSNPALQQRLCACGSASEAKSAVLSEAKVFKVLKKLESLRFGLSKTLSGDSVDARSKLRFFCKASQEQTNFTRNLLHHTTVEMKEKSLNFDKMYWSQTSKPTSQKSYAQCSTKSRRNRYNTYNTIPSDAKDCDEKVLRAFKRLRLLRNRLSLLFYSLKIAGDSVISTPRKLSHYELCRKRKSSLNAGSRNAEQNNKFCQTDVRLNSCGSADDISNAAKNSKQLPREVRNVFKDDSRMFSNSKDGLVTTILPAREFKLVQDDKRRHCKKSTSPRVRAAKLGIKKIVQRVPFTPRSWLTFKHQTSKLKFPKPPNITTFGMQILDPKTNETNQSANSPNKLEHQPSKSRVALKVNQERPFEKNDNNLVKKAFENLSHKSLTQNLLQATEFGMSSPFVEINNGNNATSLKKFKIDLEKPSGVNESNVGTKPQTSFTLASESFIRDKITKLSKRKICHPFLNRIYNPDTIRVRNSGSRLSNSNSRLSQILETSGLRAGEPGFIVKACAKNQKPISGCDTYCPLETKVGVESKQCSIPGFSKNVLRQSPSVSSKCGLNYSLLKQPPIKSKLIGQAINATSIVCNRMHCNPCSIAKLPTDNSQNSPFVSSPTILYARPELTGKSAGKDQRFRPYIFSLLNGHSAPAYCNLTHANLGGDRLNVTGHNTLVNSSGNTSLLHSQSNIDTTCASRHYLESAVKRPENSDSHAVRENNVIVPPKNMIGFKRKVFISTDQLKQNYDASTYNCDLKSKQYMPLPTLRKTADSFISTAVTDSKTSTPTEQSESSTMCYPTNVTAVDKTITFLDKDMDDRLCVSKMASEPNVSSAQHRTRNCSGKFSLRPVPHFYSDYSSINLERRSVVDLHERKCLARNVQSVQDGTIDATLVALANIKSRLTDLVMTVSAISDNISFSKQNSPSPVCSVSNNQNNLQNVVPK